MITRTATHNCTLYSRWLGITRWKGTSYSCINLHACYHSCSPSCASESCAPGLAGTETGCPCGLRQPPPLCGLHRQLLNMVSDPCGQSPAQHLQLAALLTFVPEASANSGTAVVVTAQEMPVLFPGPRPTTRRGTIGSIKSSCLVQNEG